MDKVANYTQDQVAKMVVDYKAGVAVDVIAAAVGKSVRSVVAKLSREGVYQAKTRDAAPRATKEDLVRIIAGRLELDHTHLDSLTKASRDQLVLLATRLT